MKKNSFYLLLFLAILNISCKNENYLSNNLSEGKNGDKRLFSLGGPVKTSFGCFPTCGDPSLLTSYGPNSSSGGFSSIILYPSMGDAYFTAARNAGYYPIICSLDRTSIKHSDWASVQTQINYGKTNGANWFYIDDGLSDYIEDNVNTWNREITQSQIDSVALFVHRSPWKSLATSEYFLQRMINHSTWFQNVDIIMPYKYGISETGAICTSADLRAFLEAIKTNFPNKRIVPFLGWGADWIDQWGTKFHSYQTGNVAYGSIPASGHIEVAKAYTTENLIFYYYDYTLTQSVVNQLIDYLNTNYQMGVPR